MLPRGCSNTTNTERGLLFNAAEMGKKQQSNQESTATSPPLDPRNRQISLLLHGIVSKTLNRDKNFLYVNYPLTNKDLREGDDYPGLRVREKLSGVCVERVYFCQLLDCELCACF